MDFREWNGKELVIDLERGIDSTGSEGGSEDGNFSDGSVKLLHRMDLSGFINEKMIGDGLVNFPKNFSSSPHGQSMNGEGSGNNTLKTHMDIKMDSGTSKKKNLLNSPKPPRPPKSLSVDLADQKLIQEIADLAKLKRARVEQRKALRNKRRPKGALGTNLGAMVVTILFCLVIFWEVLANKYLGLWMKRSR